MDLRIESGDVEKSMGVVERHLAQEDTHGELERDFTHAGEFGVDSERVVACSRREVYRAEVEGEGQKLVA